MAPSWARPVRPLVDGCTRSSVRRSASVVNTRTDLKSISFCRPRYGAVMRQASRTNHRGITLVHLRIFCSLASLCSSSQRLRHEATFETSSKIFLCVGFLNEILLAGYGCLQSLQSGTFTVLGPGKETGSPNARAIDKRLQDHGMVLA